MPLHNINDFIAKVREKDLARSNRFEATFLFPPVMEGHSASAAYKTISLMVEDGMYPGILVGTRPLRINNANEQRASSIDFGGDSVTFTFLIDRDFTTKDFFVDWARSIVNPITRKVQYPDQYYAQIILSALDNKDEIVCQWLIQDVFPRSVAPVTVSSTNSEVLRLPVSFAYKKWIVTKGRDESIEIDSPSGAETSAIGNI
jgi:hypothetical protein